MRAAPCAVCGKPIEEHGLDEARTCLAFANDAAREQMEERRLRATDVFPSGSVGGHAYGKRKR